MERSKSDIEADIAKCKDAIIQAVLENKVNSIGMYRFMLIDLQNQLKRSMSVYIVELTNKYDSGDVKYKYFSSEEKRDTYIANINRDTRWINTFTKLLNEE